MILSGNEIKKHLNDGIVIEPFHDHQLNPNSYNLRLHNELLVYRNETLDMKAHNPYDRIIIPEDGFLLEPGKVYLGRTVEYTEVFKSKDGTHYTWIVDGRSSVGRLGITTHVTAGFGDCGFKGYITWEISCIQPVWIYPNVEIGQIYYFPIQGEVTPYNSSKYQDSKDIVPSRMFMDFHH